MPYINLLPIAPIHIETIKTEFDVGLVELESLSQEKEDGTMKSFNALPSLKVDVVGSSFGKEKGLSAHICLTMSKHDLPEGTSRMINELINHAQGYQESLILRKEEQEDVEENNEENQ